MCKSIKLLTFIELLFLLGSLTISCQSAKEGENTPKTTDTTFFISDPEPPKYTEMEQKLINFGMQDIAEIDSTIGVQLVYATPDNFLGHTLYSDIHHAFMIPAMAQKLVKAQQRLKTANALMLKNDRDGRLSRVASSMGITLCDKGVLADKNRIASVCHRMVQISNERD